MAESEKSSRRSAKRLRCAIYTRKSSEEGLEQAFNSLDAQREYREFRRFRLPSADSGDQPANEFKGLLLNSLRNGTGNIFLEAGKFGLQTGNFVPCNACNNDCIRSVYTDQIGAELVDRLWSHSSFLFEFEF